MNIWTDEMDSALKQGYEAGKSARLIGDELGVTRNSVLGRTFRLGLCKSYGDRRAPTTRKSVTLVDILSERKMLPDQMADRISDLREMGASWTEIGADLGVSMATARTYAKRFGILVPAKMMPVFSEEDYAYIIKAWNESIPLEDIADKLGRSFGATRQKVLKLQRLGRLGTRDQAKTRLLKRYGEAALAVAATPAEALKKLSEAKQIAFAAAVNASRAAKRKRYDYALTVMRADIAAGNDRDAAVFACRAEGVTLEEIAAEFGVTRERIRQICNTHAQTIAIKGLMS